jgi:hypothetical protein
LLTAGAAGVAVVALAFFAFFLFETFEAFTGAEASLLAVGAVAAVAGAVWANDIAASARVMVKAEMIFMVFISFFRGALFSLPLYTKTRRIMNRV